MKKFVVAAVSAVAFAGLTAGAASAQCPTVSASPKDTSGTPILPGLEVGIGSGADTVTIYGQDPLGAVGFGESEIGTNGTNATYSGEVAGGIGHGEVEDGSVGTGGVSGSADGQVTGTPVSGSGSATVLGTGDHVSVGGALLSCTTVPLP
jgi:hypothetical protein